MSNDAETPRWRWADLQAAFFAHEPDLTRLAEAQRAAMAGARGNVVDADPHSARGPRSWRIFGAPPDPEAWGWIPFAEPLRHPRALAVWASRIGIGEGALQQVIDREAFVDDAGEIVAWPWYREQDAALSAVPLEEGVRAPERFLDEPYEARFYLERSGLGALLSYLEGRGIQYPEHAFLDGIPLGPLPERQAIPGLGGGEVEHPATRAAQWICRANQGLEYASEAGRPRWIRLQQDALHEWLGVGVPRRRLDEAVGHVLPDDLPVDLPVALTQLCTDGPHAYLKTHTGLWIRGAARRYLPIPGELHWVQGHLMAVEIQGEAFVYDLRDGRPRVGTWGALLGEVGALDRFIPDQRFYDPDAFQHRDASGRFALADEQVIRVADGAVVGVVPQLEDWDEDDDDDTQMLVLDPGAPDEGSVVAIDGIRFTLGGAGTRIDSAWRLSFALGPDGWRIVTGRRFLVGSRVVATFATPIAMAALSEDGTTAWVVEGERCHRLRWTDTLEIVHSEPLALAHPPGGPS